ncbi:MAG: NAD-dependent epimerase/dehydratase family protein [Candidatus Levybacteria bacterium]|nr:NAD-dependent epimerase/dehydratase family protein [Candidatus Levybacteria bacterium]
MKRYLITGGTGFIGRNITEALLKRHVLIRILDNEFRNPSQVPKNTNVEFIKGDIRDTKTVLNACRGVESIIHLAFINGTKNFYEKPDLVLSVGVKGILNVLDGAKMHNVTELFLASSSEVYQTPQIIPTPEDVPFSIPSLKNPRYSYAGGKIISELLSYHVGRTFLKKVVIFRPHNVYGPNMGKEHVIPELITKILTQKQKRIKLQIQGSGRETRSFIYIDDFTNALLLILKKGKSGEVYNVGTDEEISIARIVKMLEKIADKKINLVKSPSPPGSVIRRCPDIRKIIALGFTPTKSLEEGLKQTYLWYNTHKNAGDNRKK